MADRESKKVVLEGEEALALYRVGKDAWNKWARNNPGAEVSFRGVEFKDDVVNFKDFVFPGEADFTDATFSGEAEFNNAKFGGDATFNNATFGGYARFSGATFDENVSFEEVTFGKNTSFTNATFSRDVSFVKTTFSGSTGFRNATFNGGARFVKTTFSGDVRFGDATFNGGAEFSGATFRRGAEFEKVTFGGDAKFWNATFSGDAKFWNATFSGDAGFNNATFSGNAVFRRAEFSGYAMFRFIKFCKYTIYSDATFKSKADFSDANFGSSVNLTNAEFAMVPDFRRTKLSAHFDLQDISVDFRKSESDERFVGFSCKKAEYMEDAGRLRRLKELASIAKDHKKEQDFFALELKAERFHETTGVRLLLGYAYQGLSNFGRSVARPVACLAAIWLSCGMYFALSPIYEPCIKIGEGFWKSTSLVFPFLGTSRASLKADFAGSDAVVAFLEGGLGVMFLFLIGLALRNRFRI